MEKRNIEDFDKKAKQYTELLKDLDTEILDSVKLLTYLMGIKLKKQKQYDFFLCKEVWVHKLIYGDNIIFLAEEDFEKLKKLNIECITID